MKKPFALKRRGVWMTPWLWLKSWFWRYPKPEGVVWIGYRCSHLVVADENEVIEVERC